jgi:hypothetical protein
MLVGLAAAAQGSWSEGFGFWVWSFFVHDVQVSRHVALIEQLVQLFA